MIPQPAKKRLIQLTRLLSLSEKNLITSGEIETLTGWKDTTIRKDISYVLKKHPVKSASNGYNKENLLKAILQTLETEEKKKCCIIGLGKIAQALIQAKNFNIPSFDIIAGFDESVNRVETLNTPFPLFVLSNLENKIQDHTIQYVILDVEDKDASAIAQRLATTHIKGIVNYTNAILPVGEKIKVENVSVIAALQNLAY